METKEKKEPSTRTSLLEIIALHTSAVNLAKMGDPAAAWDALESLKNVAKKALARLPHE